MDINMNIPMRYFVDPHCGHNFLFKTFHFEKQSRNLSRRVDLSMPWKVIKQLNLKK